MLCSSATWRFVTPILCVGHTLCGAKTSPCLEATSSNNTTDGELSWCRMTIGDCCPGIRQHKQCVLSFSPARHSNILVVPALWRRGRMITGLKLSWIYKTVPKKIKKKENVLLFPLCSKKVRVAEFPFCISLLMRQLSRESPGMGGLLRKKRETSTCTLVLNHFLHWTVLNGHHLPSCPLGAAQLTVDSRKENPQ